MKIKRGFRLTEIVEWIFVVSIILSSGTMYGVMRLFYDHGINDYMFRIFSLISACLLIITYLLKRKAKITIWQCSICIGAIIFFGIYLLGTRENINSCLENLCIPFLLFLVICSIRGSGEFFIRFFDVYSKIIIVIAIVSLVFYFCGTTFGVIKGTSMEYFNNNCWNSGTNYFYLSFVNDWQTQKIFGRVFVRNIGIFMEAPGFAYPLIMTLWWELFGKEKLSKWKIVILLITLVTTFSAKALILGFVTLFFYLYTNASDKIKFWKQVRRLFFPLVITSGTIFTIYILQQKIIASGNFGSWHIRMNDVYAAFRTWINHPLLGAGFYNLDEIFANYPVKSNVGTPTMGVLNVLAFGGVYMLIGYLGGLIRYYIKAMHTKTSYIINVFLVLNIAFMCTSGNQYSYSLILIIALGWSISKSKFVVIRR